MIHTTVPRKLGREEIEETLGLSLPELASEVRGVRIKLGKEHSRFLEEKMSQIDPLSSSPRDLLSVFQNEGRYLTETTLRDYMEDPDCQLPAAGMSLDYNRRLFAGKQGHASSLHFDWNSSPNLLVNLSGHKRISLFSPSRSFLLAGFSNFYLGASPRVEETVHLAPMEALLMPPFWWHQAHYETDAYSVSVRFKTADTMQWQKHVYPTWKGVWALSMKPGILPRIGLIASSTSDIHLKFRLIEEQFDKVLNLNTGSHAYYEIWSKAYLIFQQENHA